MLNDLRIGIITLMSSKISSDNSAFAFTCFKKFLLSFSRNFGEYNLTSNFHDLVHLPEVVLESGSLY